MYYVLCTMYNVLCTRYYVLCIMYYVLYTIYYIFSMSTRLVLQPKVICPSNARMHDLRVDGRRNALRSVLSRRRCPWRSGSARSMAAFLRHNVHMHITCFPLLSRPLMPLSMAEPMAWLPCWNGSCWASALLRNRFTFSRLRSKPGHIDEALWTICLFPYLLP